MRAGTGFPAGCKCNCHVVVCTLWGKRRMEVCERGTGTEGVGLVEREAAILGVSPLDTMEFMIGLPYTFSKTQICVSFAKENL